MKRLFLKTGGAAVAALSFVSAAGAAPILQYNDPIIAIDADPPGTTTSSYPSNELPLFAFDGNSLGNTKYLNFGEEHSGVIVTPFGGPFTLRSMLLTTANDAVERDPASWRIWGTNDTITTPDNTAGPSLENWTLIGQGDVALPAERNTLGPVIPITNETPYSSYRITFPTVKNAATANSMQINEIALFEDNAAAGVNFALNPADARAILLEPVISYQSNYPAAEGPRNLLDGFGVNPNIPSQSTYPAAEGPANLIDDVITTKYFNGGNDGVGFIVTPTGGASTVRSFQLTTANDAPNRDPSSWELYGTNQSIVSADNSYGTGESWTLIGSGGITLPTERGTLGPIIPVTNEASYTSYKMIFPDRVDENPAAGGFQLAEASFFSDAAGTSADILVPGSPIIAIDVTPRTGESTKYLNFGENNSGFIVTPSAGPSTVTSFQMVTANDFPVRDPATYELYGTNDAVTTPDNQTGTAENWTLISSGALTLPEERFTEAEPVTFANTTSYTSYKMVFTTVKDEVAANSMQVASIQFFGEVEGGPAGDFDGNGVVDGADFLKWQRGESPNPLSAGDLAAWKTNFGTGGGGVGAVPEPATGLMALAGAALALVAGRRRNS